MILLLSLRRDMLQKTEKVDGGDQVSRTPPDICAVPAEDGFHPVPVTVPIRLMHHRPLVPVDTFSRSCLPYFLLSTTFYFQIKILKWKENTETAWKVCFKVIILALNYKNQKVGGNCFFLSSCMYGSRHLLPLQTLSYFMLNLKRLFFFLFCKLLKMIHREVWSWKNENIISHFDDGQGKGSITIVVNMVEISWPKAKERYKHFYWIGKDPRREAERKKMSHNFGIKLQCRGRGRQQQPVNIMRKRTEAKSRVKRLFWN